MEQDITNEILLVLDDAEEPKLKSGHDTKGAYYMTLQRKIMLRKKRGMVRSVPSKLIRVSS